MTNSSLNVSIYQILVDKLSVIRKRRRFIISSASLTLIITFATFLGFQNLPVSLPILIIAVYLATFFAILEGITDKEWLMLFIHPVGFTIAFYLFYFFLPGRWLTRLPFAVLYSISIYAILLSQNIFNVGVEKSLQLFRAASSVNFLYLTITLFMSLSLLFSFHLNFITNGFVTFLVCLPAILHFLWSVDPCEYVSREIIKNAFFVATILGETAVIFSFVPLNPAMFALLVTALFYCLSGLLQAYMQGRLFKTVMREYVFVFLFIVTILLLSLQW
ncbi:hypothetical protein A2690_02655 [Candidatus Roizmanbacteria bacterium RIFCSPHIGHO2_01_FULL_39_12b]|uniref:Uncharacterized protein n=1 Tax=Candidatus Roizmanbacteria bacterium RIFCSPHIGHO2_01_FULL_39_12b TaxID=1802030 RepID=A0A1F7GBF5_9BACT|nr:MAG: hypothetical protein A2690_02655 [Candidatus Roizmanbacteria bacterium RIFCSPHIGHO2_01_FULL_39_12b]